VGEIELSFTSALRAPRAEVWAVVSTMRGVNAELRPFVRMTYPDFAETLSDAAIVPGRVVFRSWLLAGSVVPIDRHDLAFERVMDGEGFEEESTSLLQRRWRHERRLSDAPEGGCVVLDRLVIAPRLGIARPLVALTVRLLFEHRHRVLVRTFGV
jgi:ligand-binding SRPBCC domain-containing protein